MRSDVPDKEISCDLENQISAICLNFLNKFNPIEFSVYFLPKCYFSLHGKRSDVPDKEISRDLENQISAICFFLNMFDLIEFSVYFFDKLLFQFAWNEVRSSR